MTIKIFTYSIRMSGTYSSAPGFKSIAEAAGVRKENEPYILRFKRTKTGELKSVPNPNARKTRKRTAIKLLGALCPFGEPCVLKNKNGRKSMRKSRRHRR